MPLVDPAPSNIVTRLEEVSNYNPGAFDYALVKHRDVGPMATPSGGNWTPVGEILDATGQPGSTMVIVSRHKEVPK